MRRLARNLERTGLKAEAVVADAESWGEGDSAMPSYRPFCHRVDACARLKDIERFADRLLSLTG